LADWCGGDVTTELLAPHQLMQVLNVTVEDIICYHEAGNILKHGALDNAAIVLPSTQQTPPTR
jgi:hypothetical protein